MRAITWFLNLGLVRNFLSMFGGSRTSNLGRAIWRVLPNRVSSSLLSRIEGTVNLPLAHASAMLCSSARDDHYLPLIRDGLLNWEGVTQSVWVKLVRDSEVVIDIGAYIGVYSMLAHGSNAKARILAFEPNPPTFHALAMNKKLNGGPNLELHNLALGDESGESFLVVGKDRPMTSGASLEGNVGTKTALVPVKLAMLDSLVHTADLIKIDAEGWELKVLSGASALLRKHPILILEILERPQFDSLQLFLKVYSYDLTVCLRDDLAGLTGTTVFLGPGNYMFTTNDKMAFLQGCGVEISTVAGR